MFSNIEQALEDYRSVLIQLKPYRFVDNNSTLNNILNQNFEHLDGSEIFHDDNDDELFQDNDDEIFNDNSVNLNYSFLQGDFNNLIPNEDIDEEFEDYTLHEDLYFLNENEYLSKIAEVELATIESIKIIIFDVCKIYLEGGFLENIHIEKKVDYCINYLEELLAFVENGVSDDEFQLVVINSVLIYVDALKLVFQSLKNFSINIIKTFSLDKDEHFFYIDNKSNYSKNFRDTFPDNVAYFLDLQENILRVTLIDFFLDDNISSIKYLISLENDLEDYKNYNFNIYSSVLLKINLLKNKWLKRREEALNNNRKNRIFKKRLEYRIDDKIYTLKKYKNKLLKEWLNKIDNHYEININFKDKITKEVVKYLNKDINELSFFQVHYLIKYYKDIDSNIQKLKTIMDYFLSFESNNYSTYDSYLLYDKYCFQIMKNYAINNYFSKYSENITNIEEYINEYNYCKRCLNNIVDNYFLDYKFLYKSLDFINSKININSKSENEYKEIERFSKILNSIILPLLDEYHEKKEWAKINSNFVFIMPKIDSTISLDSNGFISKVFFASSFVLPFDVKESDKNYSKVRQKYREVKSLCEVLSNLKKDLNNLENLSKEFDRKDLKSIEIIGLFTAIITFILSSIPAFKFVNTLNDAVLFTMALSVSLCLFLVLILFITRGKKGLKDFWIVLPIIFATFLVGYVILRNYEEKSINNLIDSSVENKLKMESSDSIRKVIIEDFIKEYESKNKTNKEVKK